MFVRKNYCKNIYITLISLMSFSLSFLILINPIKAEGVTGQVYDFDYTGSVQEFIAPYTGEYLLEVWGAQGGSTPKLAGGKGGYTSGVVTLNKGEKIYIYVGGQGNYNTNTGWAEVSGGYNGGGGIRRYTARAASGGGATDMALIKSEMTVDRYRTARTLESYNSRIIVAGGGGGAQDANNTVPGYGGGLTGGGSANSSGIVRSATTNVLVGGSATQSSGGNAELYGNPDYNSYRNNSAPGSFGLGGTYYSNHTSNTHAGGGGGGWYGGGVNCHGSGGGGSGYALTATSYKPNGYNVDSRYYLKNVQVLSGNQTMPDPFKLNLALENFNVDFYNYYHF